MNVLMYPIAPEDDFPDEFCAIRQGSGEHWFYTPVGESASWMLFRAESDNAKLRELVLCLLTCHSDDDSACDKCPVNGGSGIWEFEDFCDSLLERVHDLRIEVTE